MLRESVGEITSAVNGLMQLADQYSRGQCIPWEEIEVLSGDRYTGRGRYIVKKWQKRLENEREIVTLCSNGVGVRLLTHAETANEIPRIRQKKAYRQIRRAIKQTSLVDTSSISTHDRRVLAAQRLYMAEQRRSLYRSQREMAGSVIKSEAMPVRKA